MVTVTGDAPATAAIIARRIGLDGAIWPPGPMRRWYPEDFAVFAGVLPEDKYHLVEAFQKSGHTVGMCGDGVNDAPALRQAQMGIAVSTATDVAKSAAGIVLTTPGLEGVVAAVKEGRITFQRILTYTLNSVTKKIVQVLFLAVGLIITDHAILTPMLMVLIMITGDFLGMSLTTDNVRPSPMPSAWHVGNLTIAGGFMGLSELVFCTAVLTVGEFHLGLGIRPFEPSLSWSSCLEIKQRPTRIELVSVCGRLARVSGCYFRRWPIYRSLQRWPPGSLWHPCHCL